MAAASLVLLADRSGSVRRIGLYSTSSGSTETFLSLENGVLSAGKGSLWSMCLEIRLNRGFAREGARTLTPPAAGNSRVARRRAASVDRPVAAVRL